MIDRRISCINVIKKIIKRQKCFKLFEDALKTGAVTRSKKFR